MYGKGYIWNPFMCTCENSKYVGSITKESAITCDEIIDTTISTLTKTVPTKSSSINFYILLAILLVTVALLIA